MVKLRIRKMRKGPLPYRYVFLLTFVFFIFSTAAGLWIINNGITPTLMSYADSQTKKIATLVINNAISKQISNVRDINDILVFVPNGNQKTPSVKLNADIISRVLAQTTIQVQKNLKAAENGDLSALENLSDVNFETDKAKTDGGIVWYIPLGQATKNALFGNLGPKIPVRFNAIGNVRPDIITQVKPTGINNTWIEVAIHLEVSVQIITPFATKITKLQQNIPLAMGLFPGEVPQFYNGGGKTSPSFELPSNGK
ncbi:MAG: sporulation protein YunB [Bacillota bacterium]|nr:sporulation protein YunB [Bacillota bacterium]